MNDEYLRERGKLRLSDRLCLPTSCFTLIFERLHPRWAKEEVEA